MEVHVHSRLVVGLAEFTVFADFTGLLLANTVPSVP